MELGEIDGVVYSVERNSRPWTLDINTIVLSVAESLGSLGEAVQRHFPKANWPNRYSDITPDRPTLLDLPGRRLRRAVLATPVDDSGRPTIAAISTATESAVALATGEVLGVPLLAAGVLGMPEELVAPAVIQAVIMTLHVRRSTIRHVMFLCKDANTDFAIQLAWNALPERLLPSEPAELAGGVSSDLVDPNVEIPLANDRLDVAPYVSMLATVMADRRTPLPLSVGIFGRWGSGKSTFMGMLRGQVHALAGSDTHHYCDEIVQIGFNAWHYADSNLWASLGDEIFRQLAGPSATERGDQIRNELAERLDQRRQLDADTRQAQATVATLRAKVDEAAAGQEISARKLLSTLRGSKKVDKLWAQLGITDDVEQAKLLAEQLRDVRTDAETLARIPRDRTGRLVLAVTGVLIVIGVVAALLAPAARTWLAGAIGLFGVTASAGIAALGRVRTGLRSLRELAQDVRTGLDGDQRQAIAELRRAEADQQVAEAQLAEVVARVGEIGRQLAELTPGRRLYTFLAERAQGDSYTRNLGLVSTIRKDFQQLIELMAEWRADPNTPERPVDRIVLYIDDLDRCSPRAVVDVLQAVHLLLAFDLFIVVVGVDPRWLLKSLTIHYEEILDLGGSDGWRVTPEDYLEKILNIPLVLPSMSSGSLQGLLRSMVETEEPTTVDRRQANEPTETISVEAGSEVAQQLRRATDRRPTREPARPLTEPEITLLAQLDPLVDTPREAKRLMNLYRMLRATRNLSEASRFLGDNENPGEYQAVVVLLGLLTAHARLLGTVLDAVPGGLVHRDPSTPLADFVADVEPRPINGRMVNNIIGPIAKSATRQWFRLHHGLTQVCETVTLTDVSVFQAWAPRIRRFSYVLSAPTGGATPVPARPAAGGAVAGQVQGDAE